MSSILFTGLEACNEFMVGGVNFRSHTFELFDGVLHAMLMEMLCACVDLIFVVVCYI